MVAQLRNPGAWALLEGDGRLRVPPPQARDEPGG